jgi:mannose-1-phosphate guanylyltransferase
MYIVLMAGGVGMRFWPRSRRSMPKHLLKLIDNKTMLRLAFERVAPLTETDKILVVTNYLQKDEIVKQLPEIPIQNIILEPQGRNTAPCIGLAAVIIRSRIQSNEMMVVLPADHLIADEEDFCETIRIATSYARENDYLITMGIQPAYPETGYGYIQLGAKLYEENKKDIYQVKTFAEKPNYETALRFVQSGDFLWNSGMFIWSVDLILNEIEDYIPELAEQLYRIEKHIGGSDFNPVIEDAYSRTKAVSIDYGLLELSKRVAVIKAEFDWNDLGSWEAVHNISKKDNHGNVLSSKDSIVLNSNNNYFFSNKKLIAAIDVDNLVVVEMDDALLICRKDKSQNVKSIVELLSRKDMQKYL